MRSRQERLAGKMYLTFSLQKRNHSLQRASARAPGVPFWKERNSCRGMKGRWEEVHELIYIRTRRNASDAR